MLRIVLANPDGDIVFDGGEAPDADAFGTDGVKEIVKALDPMVDQANQIVALDAQGKLVWVKSDEWKPVVDFEKGEWVGDYGCPRFGKVAYADHAKIIVQWGVPGEDDEEMKQRWASLQVFRVDDDEAEKLGIH